MQSDNETVGEVLSVEFIDDESDASVLEDFTDDGCPVCKSENLLKEGRCLTCLDCGWSKCSI